MLLNFFENDSGNTAQLSELPLMNNFGRADRIYLKNTSAPDCISISIAIVLL